MGGESVLAVFLVGFSAAVALFGVFFGAASPKGGGGHDSDTTAVLQPRVLIHVAVVIASRLCFLYFRTFSSFFVCFTLVHTRYHVYISSVALSFLRPT